MRAKISVLIAAGAALTLAAPGFAQTVEHKPHHRHHRAESHASQDLGYMRQTHASTCPSGDCVGINSPGNMGGNHDF